MMKKTDDLSYLLFQSASRRDDLRDIDTCVYDRRLSRSSGEMKKRCEVMVALLFSRELRLGELRLVVSLDTPRGLLTYSAMSDEKA